MVGGGLGPYAPGEWSDDTQMALCIARVTATGANLATDEALDEVAQGFLDWQAGGATDIGSQTRAVLSAARRGTGPLAGRMTDTALDAARNDRAGNGALMRTGIIGLVALDDPQATATATAARRVAALTHADDRCVDSCVLWSEAVRVAVVEDRLDIRAGLALLPAERRAAWLALIEQAETQPPATFARNGFTVTAFQAAWSAIHATRDIEGPAHVEAALQAAIAIGHDTDTVAAIAGALLGARYGASGLRADLVRRVHGWPGLRARDLVRLALATATGGRTDHGPATGSTVRGDQRPLGRPHPDDLDVILGTEADLARCAELGITAVVSLSRVGDADIEAAGVAPGKHVEVWLVDSEDPAKNPHLAWTLADAAATMDQLRAEGERVLVHCVAAEHRTPAVALAYSLYVGQTPGRAQSKVQARLMRDIDGLLWQTAGTLTRAPQVASHNLAGALAAHHDGRGTYEEVKEAVRATRFTPSPQRRTTTLADLFDDDEYHPVVGSFNNTVGEAVFTGGITSQQYGELLAIHRAQLDAEERGVEAETDPPAASAPDPLDREALMDLTARLAARLTHELVKLRGTQGAFTLDVGDVFLQAGSYEGDAVLVEIPSDEFLLPDLRLGPGREEELLRLGFNRPTEDMPNWWIGVEDGDERALFAAARATVEALLHLHHVDVDALTEVLPYYGHSSYPPTTPAPRPAPTTGEGEALAVATTYGEVVVYPNGYAALNGEPWAERPVLEWVRLDDGRLSIGFAVPDSDYFPNVGFAADTPANAGVLRAFLPSRQEQEALGLQLAVAEHYALTCITTGTMYHAALTGAFRRLEEVDGAPEASEVVGWDQVARLAAATEVVRAFYWTRSADNSRELHDDQKDVWRAIQTWVRLSPWRDDFDFVIIPSAPRTWSLTGPEVEIQRIY